MPRKRIDHKKREEIRAYLAANGNVRGTAREFGVSDFTVRKIRDEKPDEFTQLHAHKKAQWIDEAWKTIGLYMNHVQDEKVINRTGARDSAILIGTLHDKMIKSRELDLKQQELDLKKKEVEKPNESRVVIVNDKDAMRKAMNDANQDN